MINKNNSFPDKDIFNHEQDEKNQKAFQFAKRGYIKALAAILPSVDINIKDNNGNGLFYYGIFYNKPKTTALLLEKKINPNTKYHGDSLVFTALLFNRRDTVKQLIDYGADISDPAYLKFENRSKIFIEEALLKENINSELLDAPRL